MFIVIVTVVEQSAGEDEQVPEESAGEHGETEYPLLVQITSYFLTHSH